VTAARQKLTFDPSQLPDVRWIQARAADMHIQVGYGRRVKAHSICPQRLRAAAPELPPKAALIVFDNVCVLCSGFVQWVMARDRGRLFWFTSAQGPIGQALYNDLGLDPVRFETNLVVIDGVAYGKLEAFVEVANRLGGIWRAAAALRILPAPLRDGLYDGIAQNRYRLFGKRETCWLPRPGMADRVI
jgi:predicted DCC family thiol-disulfide oxidoreductase YuxK